ncbi:MAG: UDP-3-O-(3-hydroxymyristoyl)glucosamine N-acyltransferase [Blastocatellia bacterium]
MKLAELASRINAELRGDGALDISGAAPLAQARAGHVTFAADAARLKSLPAAASAIALIVSPKIADNPALAGHPLLLAANPKLAFARAIAVFHGRPYVPGGVSADLIQGAGTTLGLDCTIHPRVTIGCDCVIGARVTLHPGVVLGDRVRVGDDTTLHANVSVYDDTGIGARCRIHGGTVIGADGFSFVPDEQGHQYKILQVGRVVIEDDVEIGANCCVDRAGFGETRIRRGAKFDNLIQIGHNCDIGEDTVIAALAGFSGGTTTGQGCVIAGQVGTNQHISIGDRAIVAARTGVTKSVAPGRFVAGLPMLDYREWLKSTVLYARLPELFERMRTMEREMSDVRCQMSDGEETAGE